MSIGYIALYLETNISGLAHHQRSQLLAYIYSLYTLYTVGIYPTCIKYSFKQIEFHQLNHPFHQAAQQLRKAF